MKTPVKHSQAAPIIHVHDVGAYVNEPVPDEDWLNSFAPVPIKFRSNSNRAFFVAMATLKDVRACILFSQ
jgi:hypothetical protein